MTASRLRRVRERDVVDRRAGCHVELDLHHDREDHRPPLRPFEQILRQAVFDLRLEQADLADVVAWVLDGLADAIRSGRDDGIFRSSDKTARNDLRATDEIAGLLVDRYHDEEHAVGRQGATVAQDDVADLAHR